MAINIKEAGLSVRITNCLIYGGGFNNMEEVRRATDQQLLRRRPWASGFVRRHMTTGPGDQRLIACAHGLGFRCQACYPPTLRALVRLSAAALARDATMGDPIALLNARAELHNANLEAMEAIGQAIGRTT